MRRGKRLAALLVGAALLCSGCDAMLERDYSAVSPHSAAPEVEEDQAAIRAESYQEVVNALVYFVAQRQTQGIVRLYNYPYDVEQGLDAACREVLTEDPLGAYALRDIQFDLTPIVSCYEAKITLRYRKSREEIDSVASATGVSALRGALQEALGTFQNQRALRLSHFDGGEEEVLSLLWQAYFDQPDSALDPPVVQLYFYPEDGLQRILELRLSYHLRREDLLERQAQVRRWASEVEDELWDCKGDEGMERLCRRILETVSYDPQGGGTVYDAVTQGSADSQGLSLSLLLLGKRLGYSCQLVQGSREGEEHTWAVVPVRSGWRHVDLSELEEGESPFRSDREMDALGYQWDTAAVPQCGEQPLPRPEEPGEEPAEEALAEEPPEEVPAETPEEEDAGEAPVEASGEEAPSESGEEVSQGAEG